jgi:hypothetical protein
LAAAVLVGARQEGGHLATGHEPACVEGARRPALEDAHGGQLLDGQPHLGRNATEVVEGLRREAGSVPPLTRTVRGAPRPSVRG